MYCPKCKRSWPEGVAFCGTCGAPLVQEPKKKKGGYWKGLLCGLLIMAVIGGAAVGIAYFAARPASETAAHGYDTPEKAVYAYFDAMKAGDVEGMLDTFVSDEFLKHYDLDLWAKNYHAPRDFIYLPADNDLAFSLNLQLVRRHALRNIIEAYIYDLYPDMTTDGLTGSEIEAYFEQLSAEDMMDRLATIEIKNMYSVDEINDCMRLGNKKHPFGKHYEYVQDLYGFEDYSDYLIAFEMDGETFYRVLAQGCYNGKWYNLTDSCVLALNLPFLKHGDSHYPSQVFTQERVDLFKDSLPE